MENEKTIKHETEEKEAKSKNKKHKEVSNKKLIFVAISGVVLILLGLLIFKMSPNKNVLSVEEAKTKAETFINDNLMLPGTKATITGAEKEYGLYKISVDVGNGEVIESYISQDGALFIPQAIDIEKYNDGQNGDVPTSEVTNKQDKLEIELFVMSHCPYGIQMEKGLIPVIELLKDKVNFTLKFNTYAMHDKVELEEELNQYCIQRESKDKLLGYLKCFNTGEKSDTCLGQLKIDKNKINNCVKEIDGKYKIIENYGKPETWLNSTYPTFPIYQEDNDKYGVQGSPTLIINGEMTSSNRDSQSLLDLACSGFTTPPSECGTQLSTTAPGFGFGE